MKLAPESLVLSNRYAWTVKLDNGMTVELGRDQGDAVLKERIARLVAVYPQLLERLQGKIESVDLRYPNGMALKADGMVLAALNGKKK
jgi:cell division protein FtsQ